MAKTLQVHDHAVHFYHLHALDWVDVLSALKADPKKTSETAAGGLAQPPDVVTGLFPRHSKPAEKFIESGQLGC